MQSSESDTLILQCPNSTCGETFPVSIHSQYATGATYGIENAPLYVIAEVNYESKRGSIECIHCGLMVYLEVCYAAKVRYRSSREREGGLPWLTA